MNSFKEIGNIEILKYFLSLHYEVFHFYEFELKDDFRAYEYLEILKKILSHFKTKKEVETFYQALFLEAQNRGLKEKFPSKNCIFTQNFEQWKQNMLKSPTYIREINATNFLGNQDIAFAENEVIGFDYPVRKACKILNKRGYKTYWSSANK